MFIDGRSIETGSAFECDLCVVGAGPAGISIAHRLRSSGLTLILIESGGFRPELDTQSLFSGENIGRDYYSLDSCRWRYFGGSSNRWGGMCHPLEPIDFQRHDWLPWSGWPIGEESLSQFYAATSELCQLPRPYFDAMRWRDVLPEPLPLAGSHFQNTIFQHSPANLGELHRHRLATARDQKVFLHSNVTQIRLAENSSRVHVLEIKTLTGRSFSVRPRAVILAAGGIENPRILLSSRSERPDGLGNENDLVGRFFMEHLHVGAGHLLASNAANRRFYRNTRYNSKHIKGYLTPSAGAIENLKLLTTSIALESSSYSIGPPRFSEPSRMSYGALSFYSMARATMLRPVVETLRYGVSQGANLTRRYASWQKSRQAISTIKRSVVTTRLYSLYFRAAQAPNPESRITLSNERDALGVPRIQLDWKVADRDTESIMSWLHMLNQDLRDRDIGEVILPAAGWESDITGGPHHMGTTRMAAVAKDGVVNADCRLHSVSNLYVAGSSVFATGGYANPTFTIISLALRLADLVLRDLR